MKHLGLLPIILLLGTGFISGLADAELTASQQVPSPAAVGETVMVTVLLTYNGANSTMAVVTPSLPYGVVSDAPGSQTTELYPGALAPVSYPIRAEQSGTYWIVSQIAYDENGIWRRLRLEAPFTATGGVRPEPQSVPGGISTPGQQPPGGITTPGQQPPGGITAPGQQAPGDIPAPGQETTGDSEGDKASNGTAPSGEVRPLEAAGS